MCGKRQLRSRVPWKVRSFLPCGRDSAGFLRCSWPDNSGGLMLMAEQVIAEAWHGDVIGPLVPTTMRRRYETLASYNALSFHILSFHNSFTLYYVRFQIFSHSIVILLFHDNFRYFVRSVQAWSLAHYFIRYFLSIILLRYVTINFKRFTLPNNFPIRLSIFRSCDSSFVSSKHLSFGS